MNDERLPAELYHSHHAPYLDDLPYWQSLVDRCARPALELGCGTGRILLPLVQSGHTVWGLDRNADMLAYLRRHLPANPPAAIELIEADMTSFDLAHSFGLIFIPCNTISTLDRAQRQAAYANLKRHLLAGGYFAASLPNPSMLRDLEAQPDPEVEDEFIHPSSGNPVQVSSAYWLEDSQFVLNWHYDQLFPDGRVERTTITQRQHLLSPTAWQQELQQAGLQLQALWGDFDRQPYSAASPHLIWEAQLAPV